MLRRRANFSEADMIELKRQRRSAAVVGDEKYNTLEPSFETIETRPRSMILIGGELGHTFESFLGPTDPIRRRSLPHALARIKSWIGRRAGRVSKRASKRSRLKAQISLPMEAEHVSHWEPVEHTQIKAEKPFTSTATLATRCTTPYQSTRISRPVTPAHALRSNPPDMSKPLPRVPLSSPQVPVLLVTTPTLQTSPVPTIPPPHKKLTKSPSSDTLLLGGIAREHTLMSKVTNLRQSVQSLQREASTQKRRAEAAEAALRFQDSIIASENMKTEIRGIVKTNRLNIDVGTPAELAGSPVVALSPITTVAPILAPILENMVELNAETADTFESMMGSAFWGSEPDLSLMFY